MQQISVWKHLLFHTLNCKEFLPDRHTLSEELLECFEDLNKRDLWDSGVGSAEFPLLIWREIIMSNILEK